MDKREVCRKVEEEQEGKKWTHGPCDECSYLLLFDKCDEAIESLQYCTCGNEIDRMEEWEVCREVVGGVGG